MKKLTLSKVVNTELGTMTVKEYFDKAINCGAIFWEAKREGVKRIRYWANLGKNSIEINKTIYDYAILRVKKDFTPLSA